MIHRHGWCITSAMQDCELDFAGSHGIAADEVPGEKGREAELRASAPSPDSTSACPRMVPVALSRSSFLSEGMQMELWGRMPWSRVA